MVSSLEISDYLSLVKWEIEIFIFLSPNLCLSFFFFLLLLYFLIIHLTYVHYRGRKIVVS